MKNPKPNAALVWKQIEDHVVPRLAFSVTDRAVYSHLLRHSRLEGKLRLRFSITWLARGVRLTNGPVRDSVRRLAASGVLRLIERSKAGHVVETRLPDEIGAVPPASIEIGRPRSGDAAMGGPSVDGSEPAKVSIEEFDFMRTAPLRQAIHARENGQCFYCLRRITGRMQCLDHVLPRARMGLNSYRNLVSCCMECNSRKGEVGAKDFLRWLYREQRLTAAELSGRLRALEALAAGKLRPRVGDLKRRVP